MYHNFLDIQSGYGAVTTAAYVKQDSGKSIITSDVFAESLCLQIKNS